MNDTLTNGRLIPRQSITVYHDDKRQAFYLERREIKRVNGTYQLLAPTPLPDSVFREISKSFIASNLEMDFAGIIQPHILFAAKRNGQPVVMWYRPPMKRTLNFSSALSIKGDSFVNVPATLYLVNGPKLYVYALAGGDRPDAATKLYKAPFFNIYTNGNVCLGTAAVGRKGKTYEEEVERFERAFYMAEQNGGQSIDNCKTPLPQLWSRLIKNKAAFPSKSELKQHSQFKTVGDLLAQYCSL